MSFVSYAQNFEDVMLWRALKHVDKGSYIDIGAQDPIVDSVSLAFYEHGWRGVHVEPTQQYSSRLRNARPEEILEQLAIGDSSEKTLTFFEFPDTGLSTADPEVAKRHELAGYKSMRTEVLVISLDSLLDKHGNQDVHWLKLDVEGLETSALKSWNHSLVRPWILVIESTRPLTQEQNHIFWEAMVVAKGYEFAYFDGLNRFYVHESHKELLPAFSSPPNIFDGFVLGAFQPFCKLVAEKGYQSEINLELATAKAHQASDRAFSAEAKAQQASDRAFSAESKAQQASERAVSAEAKAQQAGERAIAAQAALIAIHQSSSWRVTEPLRIVGRKIKAISQLSKIVKSKTEVKTKLLLSHAKLYINRRPALKHFAFGVLVRFPSLARRIRKATIAATPALMPLSPVATRLRYLTPRARKIYSDINLAIESQNEEKS